MTFPPDVPPEFDDAAVIQAHDWQAFCQIEHMHSHWQRPGWTPGRRSYHWLVTFDEADNVRHLAKQCQAQLVRPELDLVPLESLHITMGRVGFTDKVTHADADTVARQAMQNCATLTPFELTIGPLAGSHGAIRFSVAPWTPLFALHQALTTATRTILDERTVLNTNTLRPHLSIAYANTDLSIAETAQTIEGLRQLPAVTTKITSVALVELRREGKEYRYDVLMLVKLG